MDKKEAAASKESKPDEEIVEQDDTETGERPKDIDVNELSAKAAAGEINTSQATDGAPRQAIPNNTTAGYPRQAGVQPTGVKKLKALTESYPDDTPLEHIVFGYGEYIITVGDLYEAFNIKRGK